MCSKRLPFRIPLYPQGKCLKIENIVWIFTKNLESIAKHILCGINILTIIKCSKKCTFLIALLILTFWSFYDHVVLYWIVPHWTSNCSDVRFIERLQKFYARTYLIFIQNLLLDKNIAFGKNIFLIQFITLNSFTVHHYFNPSSPTPIIQHNNQWLYIFDSKSFSIISIVPSILKVLFTIFISYSSPSSVLKNLPLSFNIQSYDFA